MSNRLTLAVTELKDALAAIGVDVAAAVLVRVVVPLAADRVLVTNNLTAGGATVTLGTTYDNALGIEIGSTETRDADLKRIVRRASRNAFQSGVAAGYSAPRVPGDIGGGGGGPPNANQQ